MGASGVERHHDFWIGIGRIDLCDLRADRGIVRAIRLAFELADLRAIGENGDGRKSRNLAKPPSCLPCG